MRFAFLPRSWQEWSAEKEKQTCRDRQEKGEGRDGQKGQGLLRGLRSAE